MSEAVQFHICNSEEGAYEAKGFLEGLGYEVKCDPEKVDGAVNREKDGGTNESFFDRWVVIGKK